eukprot:m.336276 g.336276  ORF g.336276 m.336276 type:complete len:665 (+) comp17803_c0_seq1:118-2112(+)
MSISCLVLLSWLAFVSGRPTVRNIKTNAEFSRVLSHHKETGMPVIVDYYSDGCGPCRMIAPIYKKMAKEFKGRAVFTKVDVNWNRETSSAQRISSMPTFQFYLNGKKKHQFSGGDPNQLRQWVQMLATEGDKYNVQVSKESLVAFYKENAPDKLDEKKLDELLEKAGEGGGPGHYKLIKKLDKKYGKKPETTTAQNREAKDEKKRKEEKSKEHHADPKALHTIPLEELKKELERRQEEAAEAVPEEEAEAEEAEHAFKYYEQGDFPERVTIIGGGPAGLSAAIYAARAGLRPVVVAPPMGGQLQGKGVMVENFPAVFGVTGPTIVFDMMKQANEFGTSFEQSLVTSVDVTTKPFSVVTNTTTIKTHTIILATGADSRWLGVDGEEDYRGGGVSSCATCDGFLFKDQEVVVIGGGDAAMEDALVLARTSTKVTVVHRRDSFRASHILAQRVLENDKIEVLWNKTVDKFAGVKETIPAEEEGDEPTVIDTLKEVYIKDVNTGEQSVLTCAAAFIAIGHTPNTGFVKGVVEMDSIGYVNTIGDGSTKTSIEGVFAAGDVTDKVYRQAVTSAGSGAMAALDAERWLSEHGIGDEAAEFEAALLAELLEEEQSKERETFDYPDAYKEKEPVRPEKTEEKQASEEAPVNEDDEGVEEVQEEEEEVAHTEL